MTSEERNQMNRLCTRIQEEKDYDKFKASLLELNLLIQRKEQRLGHHAGQRAWQRTRPWRTVSAIVKKIVKPLQPEETERAEISIAEADDLFREIRVENRLTDVDGSPVALKQGAYVEVTFEAEAKDTVKTTLRSA